MDRKKFLNTYNMALIAVSAALITICSWISVPFGSVPFTLQTLAIFAILMILGGKRGTVTIAIYLLLGLVGLPVFANFQGGAARLVGPTGGYLVGFLFVGLIYWLVVDVLLKNVLPKNRIAAFAVKAVVCVVTLAVLYVFGTVWFVNIYTNSEGNKVGYAAAMAWCVTPFIIPDLAKLAVATVIAERTSKFIKN